MTDTIVSGPVHGNVYTLIAADVSLISGIADVVDFAQDSIVGFDAMLGWWFIGVCGWPQRLVLLAVAASSALIGRIINLTTVRPLIKTPPIAALLATFVVSVVFDNLNQTLFRADTREHLAPLPTDDPPASGVRFGTSGTVVLGFIIAAMPVLWV